MNCLHRLRKSLFQPWKHIFKESELGFPNKEVEQSVAKFFAVLNLGKP